MTEWKPLDEHYEVSRCGKVRKTSGQTVGQFKNSHGYLRVRLGKPRRLVLVHRLVAFAFIPNPDALPSVNHLDCDRANNHASNLEWCTQLQNLRHARRLGRMPDNYWKGKRSPAARLSDEQAANIRDRYAAGGASFAAIAKEFGTSKRTVGRIISGEHYG